jgi:hypothetical protein
MGGPLKGYIKQIPLPVPQVFILLSLLKPAMKMRLFLQNVGVGGPQNSAIVRGRLEELSNLRLLIPKWKAYKR